MSFRPKIKSASASSSKPTETQNRFLPLTMTSPSKALSPYERRAQAPTASSTSYKQAFFSNLAEFPALPSPSPSPTKTPITSQSTTSHTPWTLRSTQFITGIEDEHETKSFK